MDKQTFLARLSDALDKDFNKLDLSTPLEQCDWDSLSAITFVSFASDYLNKNLDASQVQEAKTLGDLLNICF